MQLVWLSPIILYPMLKFRSLFFAIILGIGLFLSILVPFVLTYSLKLTGTMLYYKKWVEFQLLIIECISSREISSLSQKFLKESNTQKFHIFRILYSNFGFTRWIHSGDLV